MKHAIIGLTSGTLFGTGLALSGMMDPLRVRGFLDLFGDWDPTLAFVMGGAVIVMGFAWVLQRQLAAPLLAERFDLPDTRRVDARLLGGAALFGIGWGLTGLCPGPAIGALVVAPVSAAIFVLAMIAGMAVAHWTSVRRS